MAEVAEEQPRKQDSEKGEVAGDEEALRVDKRAEALGDASTIPPISVPHSDPAPPITEASKAKMSCAAPA